MTARRPPWRPPLILLPVVLALAGVVLLVSGRIIAGLGAVSAGTLLSSVLLLRMQIRAGDQRTRSQRPRQ